MALTIEMTLRGVLLAGKWRTEEELNHTSTENKRNTLIVEMAAHSNQNAGHFQAMNDEQLIGVGAVAVFLRKAKIRDDVGLKTMISAGKNSRKSFDDFFGCNFFTIAVSAVKFYCQTSTIVGIITGFVPVSFWIKRFNKIRRFSLNETRSRKSFFDIALIDSIIDCRASSIMPLVKSMPATP
jgi:hypothetical protein